MRPISHRTILAGALSALAAAAPLLHAVATAPSPSPAPAPAPGAAGTLRLAESQWRTLGIQAVAESPFATVLVADAGVALDDEKTVPVFAPANGRVVDVRARVGQHVSKGEALAFFSGIETAQAAADLASADAARASASEQLELARAAERRAHAVLEAGGGAEKGWLQSRADLAAAEAARSSTQAAYAAARTKAEAAGWRAGTPVADAAKPTALRAPSAGEVVQRQVAAGQLVNSLASGATTPLFAISDLRRLWVVAGIPETDAGRVHVGQEAEISVAGGAPRRARVAWIAPMLDAATRRLPIRMELENADRSLKPQMSATVRLLQPDAAPALAVPTSSVVRDDGQARCYVVVGDRAIAPRAVRIGRSEGGMTQILSGLAAGERIVARGALFVDAMAEGGS